MPRRLLGTADVVARAGGRQAVRVRSGHWARAGGEAGRGCGYISPSARSLPARGAVWLLERPLSLAGGWMGRERFRTGDSGGWFGLPWVVCWCWPDVGTHADTDE